MNCRVDGRTSTASAEIPRTARIANSKPSGWYGDLPIVPQKWKHTPNNDKAAQLKILKELL
ncbi:MAG: hypothetical protein LBN43_00125, partial [Oscillospiraceae bacterium]|nr:hypothetical protein [Oscillospiraceae bacterium]